MELRTKLTRLQCNEDLALYKWSAGKGRIADDYILLSNLRLNTLICDGGRVLLSIAAPVLFMEHGRPVIRFLDSDVLTVFDGSRRNINIVTRMLQDGEQAAPAQYCDNRELKDDRQPKWIESKVLSMGCSSPYPVSKFLVPEIFRISRRPETLRPIFDRTVMKVIGGEREDSVSTLMDKFQKRLLAFGCETTEGYVISNDYIAAGGCCVVASKGISQRSGSYVHSMPLSLFKDEINRRGWPLHI